MIHIEQNQQLKDEPQMRVAVSTGDYNETDLIECYKDGEDPNTPTAMYQAQFIVLGRHIYHQSEELTEDQLNALLANIPADQVINNRKMMDGKKPAAKYVGKVIQRKGRIAKRELRTDVAEETQQATTTQPVVQTPVTTDTATSTPPIATSTPVDTTNTATTTPIDTSTSTPTFFSTSTPSDTSTSTATTTPDFSTDTSSTTPDTITSTTTDSSTMPTSTPTNDIPTSTPIVDPQADTTASSSEIVAFAKSYAKKKILKRLNL